MITITIETGNAAFSDGNRSAEIARILRELADKLDRNATLCVYDVNGNRCGAVTLTGKDRNLYVIAIGKDRGL